MSTALEFDNVGFAFGAKKVLEGVSFSVKTGDYFSIIGPNGAGKSTLLKLINRIHTGAKGAIRIEGKPIEKQSQRQLARIIGYVPQTPSSLFPYTAFKFVMMGRYPHLSPFTPVTTGDVQAARDAMEVTGTANFCDRYLDSLSGGERQRVYIAAAIAQGARILLLDEPNTFLDPKSQDQISEALVKLNTDMGVTILIVTHDINSAALGSDTIMALKDGRMVFNGPPEKLMNENTLESIYEKKFLLTQHPVTGSAMIAPDIIGRGAYDK